MNMDCEVIRDLLPLYADDACSEKSRRLVNEHLLDCEACRDMLNKIKESEIESGLKSEKESVIQYGIRRFRRRSAAVGSAVSGVFMIPILVCLVLNMGLGPALDWFSIVLAALCVAASLIIVPLTVSEDKLFWTFCAFCASLMLLLGVVCMYTHGGWFWIAASAALFGLAAVFLPFVIKARPVQRLIGGNNRWVIVLGLDTALFLNMMNMIASDGKMTLSAILFSAGVIAGIGLVVTEIIRKRGNGK